MASTRAAIEPVASRRTSPRPRPGVGLALRVGRQLAVGLALGAGSPSFLLAFSLALSGCSASYEHQAKGPVWVGIDQQAFPDDIAPGALGLPATQRKPYADPQVRERTRRAEVVARVRVQTVSVERRSNGDPVYRIGLQLAAPRLVDRLQGEKAMPEVIEVVIAPDSPAHALARAWDVRLQGKIFVGFFKTYADENGEPVIHFHLGQDDPALGAAVQQFAMLDEVRGS